MAVQTSAGSSLLIGTTLASLLNDAYVVVNEITNLGQFGRSYEEIKYSNILNRNVIKFKGQRDDGDIQLDLGRTGTDAGQAAMRIALDIDADYNFKVTLNDPATLPLISLVTMAIATPAVFTMTGPGTPVAPAAGTPCVLTSTGPLPTGFVPGTTYFVVAPSGATFELAATPGGTAIGATGAPPTQPITAQLNPGTPTTFFFKAKVMAYQTTVGPPSQVVSARAMLGITSGTIMEIAPT